MRRTVWITTLMLLLAANVSVFGGEGQDETAQGKPERIVLPAHIRASLGPTHPLLWMAPPEPVKRPKLLPILYTSLAVLHGADLATTATILERGGVERNPLMRPVVGNTASSIAVKAATSAVAIYFAEKAWRKSKVAAIVTMLAVNGLTAAVVAHNARVIAQR